MTTRLSRKIALVTGGASGLGKAIARRLAQEGATVVITDLGGSPGPAVASELTCDFLPQDVSNEAQWNDVIQYIRERHAALHILVNNAGIAGPAHPATPADARLLDWRKIFAVNVEGVFLGCRTSIPLIGSSGGGSIINISSIAGLRASPYATAYGASKAAVRHLTKSVAQYCAERKLNIRCNSVHPGDARTPLWEKFAEQAAAARGVTFEDIVCESTAIIPLGEFVTAEDVATAVVFLASEDSRHITGSKLVVDGGLTNCETFRAPTAR